MTKIKAWMDGEWFCLTAQGHAGYNPKGPDIVCAGISAICCALGGALEKLGQVEVVQNPGEFFLRTNPNNQMQWGVIYGALTGLKMIEKKFSKCVVADVEIERTREYN